MSFILYLSVDDLRYYFICRMTNFSACWLVAKQKMSRDSRTFLSCNQSTRLKDLLCTNKIIPLNDTQYHDKFIFHINFQARVLINSLVFISILKFEILLRIKKDNCFKFFKEYKNRNVRSIIIYEKSFFSWKTLIFKKRSFNWQWVDKKIYELFAYLFIETHSRRVYNRKKTFTANTT